jgi:predicted nucleotidyltransferase
VSTQENELHRQARAALELKKRLGGKKALTEAVRQRDRARGVLGQEFWQNVAGWISAMEEARASGVEFRRFWSHQTRKGHRGIIFAE